MAHFCKLTSLSTKFAEKNNNLQTFNIYKIENCCILHGHVFVNALAMTMETVGVGKELVVFQSDSGIIM